MPDSWKVYTENRISFSCPPEMQPIRTNDNASLLLVDPSYPNASLSISRILITRDGAYSIQSILENEMKRLQQEETSYDEVVFETTAGIYFIKVNLFSDLEKKQLLQLDPDNTATFTWIHRWLIGNEDAFFIFSYGFPDDEISNNRWDEQLAQLELIFNSILTKPENAG